MSRTVKALIKDTCQNHAVFLLFIAAKVMQAMGFGVTAMTASIPGQGAGAYGWFFIKRQTPREDHVAVLRHLQVSDDTTPTLAAYNASMDADVHPPPRAPTVNWDQRPEVPEEDVAYLATKLGLVDGHEPPLPPAVEQAPLEQAPPALAPGAEEAVVPAAAEHQVAGVEAGLDILGDGFGA